MRKIIIHVDMDAFYAQIEEIEHPEYKGKPIIVGALPSQKRGVVSTCNYEARKYGVHSAMPILTAYKKCPHAIFLKPRMKHYKEISNKIMDIFYSFSPKIEQISIDEAFLDCTGTELLFGEPIELAKKIQKRIFQKTGLTCSIGIASNKLIAKIASEERKPNGITLCPEGKEKEFLAQMKIERLWGVGKKTAEMLHKIGIHKVKDIQSLSKEILERKFKKAGAMIWNAANGIDERNFNEKAKNRSISKEFTFSEDTDNLEKLKKLLFIALDNILREVRKEKLFAKTISLKIRLEDFSTYNRSYSFPQFENKTDLFKEKAFELLQNFDRHNKKIRLIGISISNFSKNQKEITYSLFEREEEKKQKNLDKILDNLKDKFGDKITRATFLKKED